MTTNQMAKLRSLVLKLKDPWCSPFSFSSKTKRMYTSVHQSNNALTLSLPKGCRVVFLTQCSNKRFARNVCRISWPLHWIPTTLLSLVEHSSQNVTLLDYLNHVSMCQSLRMLWERRLAGKGLIESFAQVIKTFKGSFFLVTRHLSMLRALTTPHCPIVGMLDSEVDYVSCCEMR